MRVLHAISNMRPSAGGPPRVVVDLCDALARCEDTEVAILSQRQSPDCELPSSSRVVRHTALARSGWAENLGTPMRASLKRFVVEHRPSLIHSHGLWMGAPYWVSSIAHRNRIPLVIHTHGTLSSWALRYKASKKAWALRLYQNRALAAAQLLVATSDMEREDIRRAGFRQPVAVLPNGLSLSRVDLRGARTRDHHRIVAFLGRICEMKGLRMLLEAWSGLRPSGWRLRIAGPDENMHRQELQQLAARLGLVDSVDFVDELVTDQERSRFLLGADLLVLPSFAENFGLVVVEALAHGVPVITTTGTPWRSLAAERCGWWIDIGVQPLEDCLRVAMGQSDAERHRMGEAGRVFAARFDWGAIAADTRAAYQWVLGQGTLPAFVHLA